MLRRPMLYLSLLAFLATLHGIKGVHALMDDPKEGFKEVQEEREVEMINDIDDDDDDDRDDDDRDDRDDEEERDNENSEDDLNGTDDPAEEEEDFGNGESEGDEEDNDGFRYRNKQCDNAIKERATCSNDMCEMDVQPIGCFYDPVVRNRPLPILLRSHRDRTSHAFNNVLFNWKNGVGSIKRLLCDCVKIARKRGITHIGLQHYGECWGSKTAATDYNKEGKSKACINGHYKPCRAGEFCTGKEHANYVYAINSLNPVPCKIAYENVGCFRDPVRIASRPLPFLLESRRDRTSHAFHGKVINWKNYRTSLAELVCSCAARAKERGYRYFGVQYFGECWSGPGSESYRKYGSSGACKSAAFQPCKGGSNCLCTGDQFSNFVYALT